MRTIIHSITGIVILLSLSVASAFFTSCSSTRVYTDSNNNISFSSYKTFALLDEPRNIPGVGKTNKQIVESNLEAAIEAEMKARGYTLNEKNPDVLVTFSFSSETKTNVTRQPVYSYRPTIAAAGFWRPRYFVYNEPFVVYNRVRTEKYKEGTLVIDIIDKKSNKVIWHGWAEEPLKKNEKLSETLTETVKDILAEYPVKAK